LCGQHREEGRKEASKQASQWLTPVILVSLKAEIKRTKVQSQPREIVFKTVFRKFPRQVGHRWLTPVILATQEAAIKRSMFKCSPGKYFVRPYLEKTHYKKGWQSDSNGTCLASLRP
jgi:hypothetical protein